MRYTAFDPNTGEPYEVGGKTVTCTTEGCFNEGVPIEVPDDPNGVVICGPCGNQITEEEPTNG